MIRRLQRIPQTFRKRLAGVCLTGFILFALAAATASAAPEYALSGQATLLEKSVLARTPAGPVTALDVLMLDDMRDRTLTAIPIKAWLNPTSLEATPYRLAIKTGVERLLAYQDLAKKAGAWQPPADDLRVKSFGAAMAVWVENAVKPEVKVLDADIDRYYLAHPEKYLRRMRAQVRYVFMAADMSSLTMKMHTSQRMDALAQDIRDGKITFEKAAREFSEAPSAEQGGLLPPFYNGTFFDEFDKQTFQLEKPGSVSPSFVGPEGYYLVQLVQTWPPRNVPISEVHEDIRQMLSLDHVRHYYNYLMAKLALKHYVQNYASQWNYLNLQAPIVQINNLNLSRPDFLRFFGNPIGTDYAARMPDIGRDANYWVEGETVMEELKTRGLTQDPMIQRATALAALPLKADQVYKAQIPPEVFSPAKAMDTIRNNKQFIQGMRAARLIEFEIQPKSKKKESKSKAGPLGGKPAAAATDDSEISTQMDTISKQLAQETLPTEPTPVKLTDWALKEAGQLDQLSTDLDALQTLIDNTPWSDVKIKVRDKDWVDSIPGTSWYNQLKAVSVGQVSQPLKIGDSSFQYLVVAERPVDLKNWEAKPILIRSLAFQIEAAMIFQGAILHVRQSGDVSYTF